MASNIYVIGLHGKEEEHIILGILEDHLPEKSVSNGLEKYEWCIENKYYKADTFLVKFTDKDWISDSALNSAEALIVYLDASEVNALQDVERICGNVEKEIEVKLLVCDGFTDDSNSRITKEKVQKWCIPKGWELVELEEPELSEEDFDERGSCGFSRIKGALNAHTWQNLRMKDGGISDFGEKEGNSSAGEEEDLEDPCNEEFMKLFSSLGQMKMTADSLPSAERRVYAEKIATAFMKALGGADDDDEQDDDMPKESNR